MNVVIIEFADLADNHELSCDICIVGAGVAGQTLAMALAEKGVDVLLCESGKRDFDPAIQTLAQGHNVGEPYYDLDKSRLRLFGGTAAIWGGRCAELDAIDFEARDYIPHSGWPITKADLDPYYKKVFTSLGLERPSCPELWAKINQSKPPFDSDKLFVGLWSFDENGERFTDPNRGALKHVRTLLGATLTCLDVQDDGQVTRAHFGNLDGHKGSVTAPHFVLAAGAIETIRLLMGAVPNRPNGFGNTQDQLGRFFMEHPHARGGQIVPEDLVTAILALPNALRADGKRYAAYVTPSERLQRQEGILNTSLSFAPRRHEGSQKGRISAVQDKLKHDLPSTKFWRTLYKFMKSLAIKLLEKAGPWPIVKLIQRKPNQFGLYAVIRAEQAPHPDSRLTLSDDKDGLGLRRISLDWRLNEIEKRSVRVLMETLKLEFQRLGWGDVIPASWLNNSEEVWAFDPLISAHPIGGYHHMGGTRMSETAKTGVVNANCRLHESPNLYIASSSVFPSGGWANPTPTIMALAERLADHLEEKLSPLKT